MANAPIDAAASSASSRRFQLLFVIALAAILRLVWLDGVPPGINQDEAVNAYDAFCIGATGKDHHGTSWPVFFHSFGDYHPGPPIYVQIPFQMLLGMNVWSTRLPDALFGIAHVFVVYFLVRRFYGDRAGLWAAGLLAVSPWHIHLTRLAFGIGMSVSLTTLGLWLISRRVRDDLDQTASGVGSLAMAELAGAGFALGVALWAYHAMRVVVPLLLLAGVALYGRRILLFLGRPKGRMTVAIFVLGLLIGAAPFAWACIKTPDQAWGRASKNFILNQSPSVGAAMVSIVRTYFMHLGPAFLFFSGDPSPVQSVPGHGQLYYFDAILLPLGIYRLIRRRHVEPLGLFLLAWLLIAPIPAAITKLEFGHALRSAGALPVYSIVSALGLDLLLTGARRRSVSFGRAAVAFSVLVVAIFAARFAVMFFSNYPRQAASAFGAEYRPMIAEIQRREADYDLVILTSEGSGQVGTLYLFWNRMPPQVFFDSAKNVWEGPEWESILQVGKFLFVPSSNLPDAITQLPPEVVHPRVLVAERPGIDVPGAEIMRVAHPDGRTALILYDVRVERGH
jgi:4-amino-4-deoxy-L-arabinose transferase-like glycosyltransferase